MKKLFPWLLAALLSSTACGSDGVRVTAAEYGDKWPFKATEGTVRCEMPYTRPLVSFDPGDGVRYGLNGAARGAGNMPDGMSLVKPGKVGVDVQPFIDIGLRLCGEKK